MCPVWERYGRRRRRLSGPQRHIRPGAFFCGCSCQSLIIVPSLIRPPSLDLMTLVLVFLSSCYWSEAHSVPCCPFRVFVLCPFRSLVFVRFCKPALVQWRMSSSSNSSTSTATAATRRFLSLAHTLLPHLVTKLSASRSSTVCLSMLGGTNSRPFLAQRVARLGDRIWQTQRLGQICARTAMATTSIKHSNSRSMVTPSTPGHKAWRGRGPVLLH